MKYKTIIFDYDGTLHESLEIYMQAFLKAYDFLVENNHQPAMIWQKSEVGRFLGQNPKEMWGSFKPKLHEDVIEVASKMVGLYMIEAIQAGKAKLYEGALDVLKTLKEKGYKLIYLSNSKTYYMNAHKDQFSLDQYFDLMLCSQMFDYIPKHEILKQVKDQFEGPMVMIGDRIHDMETGYLNNIDTIACLYGYGSVEEFEKATYKIKDINEVIKLV